MSSTRPIISLALIAVSFVSCGKHEGPAGAATPTQAEPRSAAGKECVNLNSASLEDLKRLPGVGDVIAARVIEYRERHGRFRRPADIIIIQGFSEKKYRAIADFICAE